MHNVTVGRNKTVHLSDKYQQPCCGSRPMRKPGIRANTKLTDKSVTCKKCLALMANREAKATQAIVDRAFAWQAQRQADLTADNAQAEKLIASFNAIEAYKAEVAYMQTQDAPIDNYLGGSENRKAEH